jgi:hypothetical protein
MKIMNTIILVLGFGMCASLSAQSYDLKLLKKGSNQSQYVGTTKGLVRTSTSSVNNMINKHIRNSERYNNASSNDYSNSSSSNSSRSSSTASTSSRSSNSSPTGVKKWYDAGTRSSKGHKNYRVVCHNGRAKTVFRASDGFWYNVSTNMGQKYKNLSVEQFTTKFCQ